MSTITDGEIISNRMIEVEVEGIECPFCLQQFFSRYRHDMRYCKCEYCFVDGGTKYLRYGWGTGGVSLIDLAGPPRVVKLRGYRIEYTEEEKKLRTIALMGAYLK